MKLENELTGQTITSVHSNDTSVGKVTVLTLSNGMECWVMSDPEGNGAGCIHVHEQRGDKWRTRYLGGY